MLELFINMKKLFLLVLLSFFIILSCKQNDEVHTMNDVIDNVDSVRSKVLFQGDTNAYELLRIESLDSRPEEFLFISMIMANKYNNKMAKKDFAHYLIDCHIMNGISKNKIDKKTKELILQYDSKAFDY